MKSLGFFLLPILLFFFLLVSCLNAYSQNEANIWHFGYHAGIDFNSGTAVAIPGYVNTYEGCASICNNSGTLLFVTDGVTVYDVNGGIIATGLFGNNSSTQSAIIIPDPGNNNQYYIFTVAAVGSGGLHYSILDITLNGGLGGIVLLNAPLVTPVCEKLTAIYASNGIDIWVITHVFTTNEYYSYPLTAGGVGAPVISVTGSIVGLGSSFLGYMKASTDGSRIALAGYGSTVNDNIFDVSDFDNTTGIVSNTIAVPLPTTNIYGVSFSPNGSKLYASSFISSYHIIQYDLTISNWWSLPFNVFSGGSVTLGAMQVAPDGKIYIAQNATPSLSTISAPDNAGAACGFSFQSFPLTNNSAIGLPTFFEPLIIPDTCSVNLGPDTILCSVDSFQLDAGLGGISYLWENGSANQTYTVFTDGLFSVIKTFVSGCVALDSIQIIFSNPSINLGNDTLICGLLNYNINTGFGWSVYHWSNNNNQPSLIITAVGNYSVTVTNQFGCTAMDTILISNSDPQVELGNDEIICSYDSTWLIPTSGFESYLWNTGSTEQNISVSLAGNYAVTITDQFNCSASDSELIIIDTAFVFIGNDTGNCSGNGIILNAGAEFINYLWNNNSISDFIITTGVGMYSVTVTDINGCVIADTVNITYTNCVTLHVPSGFSPNQDGVNDYFHILNAQDFFSAEIKIYTRWGELIYYSNDKNAYWNGTFKGKNCEVGSYAFVISGINYLQNSVFKKGNLTLLR